MSQHSTSLKKVKSILCTLSKSPSSAQDIAWFRKELTSWLFKVSGLSLFL